MAVPVIVIHVREAADAATFPSFHFGTGTALPRSGSLLWNMASIAMHCATAVLLSTMFLWVLSQDRS